MKRFLTLGMLAMVGVLLFIGCGGDKQETEIPKFSYEWAGETYMAEHFELGIESSLDWIKANTANDAVILCWWDYGHMIRGIGERDVVVYMPSNSILDTLSATAKPDMSNLSPDEKMGDVARAFLTHDSSETAEILSKYDATHLFVLARDVGLSWTMYRALGEPAVTPEDTVLSKAANKDSIEGFELVYSDEVVAIYQLV